MSVAWNAGEVDLGGVLGPEDFQGRLENSLCWRSRPDCAHLGASSWAPSLSFPARNGLLTCAVSGWVPSILCQRLSAQTTPELQTARPFITVLAGSCTLEFIHFFICCSLNILLGSSILLGATSEAANKTDKNSFLWGFCSGGDNN